MSREPRHARPRPACTRAACGLSLSSALGCAPTLNVSGVYFPAWLVSAVVGLVAAYLLVWWLGRRPGLRSLAQSGLFFCSLTVSIGLLVRWAFFSGF